MAVLRGRRGGRGPGRVSGEWLRVPCEDDASLAALLDEARGLIVDAREQGSEPGGLLVSDPLHELLLRTKRHQIEHGAPLLVLGLPVAPIAGERRSASPAAGG